MYDKDSIASNSNSVFTSNLEQSTRIYVLMLEHQAYNACMCIFLYLNDGKTVHISVLKHK